MIEEAHERAMKSTHIEFGVLLGVTPEKWVAGWTTLHVVFN